jgi:hypothetical protein
MLLLLWEQVFHIVASVAAQTGRQPPAPTFGRPIAPATPDQSDASSSSSSSGNVPSPPESSAMDLRALSLSLASGQDSPPSGCAASPSSGGGERSTPALQEHALFRHSSTSSLERLSCSSITSSPVAAEADSAEVSLPCPFQGIGSNLHQN